MRDRAHLAMKKNQGYILLLVLLFITILMVAGGYFFIRMTSHTQASGEMRDIMRSSQLAEAGLNLVLGQYLDTQTGNSGAVTSLATFNVDSDMASIVGITNAIPNLYYITDTNAGFIINQRTPTILQRVANGEAANATSTILNSPQIVTSEANPLSMLRVNDLFIVNSTTRPRLFKLNAAGLLTPSAKTSWNAEDASAKIAVWFEAIQNPQFNEAVDVYIQAVAEVDGVKSYVQRYVNGSTAGNSGITLGAVSNARL